MDVDGGCAPCRGQIRHELKTWPKPFTAVASGWKRHEIRVNDRCFRVGDELMLQEYDPETQRYTGRNVLVSITYITNGGEWGIPDHMCVMSIHLERWYLGE